MKEKISTLLVTLLSLSIPAVIGQPLFTSSIKTQPPANSSASQTTLVAQADGDEAEQPVVSADGPIVQQGGPYYSTGDTLQQFVSLITLTEKDCTGRLVLSFFNGPNHEPKFRWVRVYFNNEIAVRSLKTGTKPVGSLIISERSFVPGSNKVQLDWSRRLRPGKYALLITGAGAKGASVKWRINAPTGNTPISSGVVAPASAAASGKATGTASGVRITGVQPTTTIAGGTLDLTGSGFTPSRDQNGVYLNQSSCRVNEATGNHLKVEVPSSLQPGNYSIQVIVDGAKSNTLAVKISPTAEIINSNLHASPSDSIIVISGKGFSPVAGDNEVTIGGTKAAVQSASQTELTIKVPYFPEAEGSPYFLNPGPMDVAVKVKNIPAKGRLQFYCSKAPW
jgi:hypothetical protein